MLMYMQSQSGVLTGAIAGLVIWSLYLSTRMLQRQNCVLMPSAHAAHSQQMLPVVMVYDRGTLGCNSRAGPRTGHSLVTP